MFYYLEIYLLSWLAHNENRNKIINSKIGLLIGVSVVVGAGALFLANYIANKISGSENSNENNWDKVKLSADFPAGMSSAVRK